ncbi:hypothetical protein EV356DRAFT_561691 [Viridothelium virens]|uniref:Tautomerase cis-CaaD-like domain-containing protein n=1 Tax=Viridothelium virens TaxID=1048519 RepID=A0A6A6GWY2_VIRVR|nr:hypothetical protein EV356DRAFT_561691 [Viridothelium virens]
MPMWEVEHGCTLTPSQKDDLAEAITKIYAEQFATPRILVNIRFTDISQQSTYVAGKRRHNNRILAFVRPSPTRTRAEYNKLCQHIQEAWDEVIASLPQHPFNRAERTAGDEKELRTIFIMPVIGAGREVVFELPEGGKEQEWYRENMMAFEKRAAEGDEEVSDMIKDIKDRNLLN